MVKRLNNIMGIVKIIFFILIVVSCEEVKDYNTNSKHYNNLAMSLMMNEKLDSAIYLFNHSIKLDSLYGTAYWNLLMAYLKTNNRDSIQKGINNIHKLNKFIPDSTKNMFFLGIYYDRIGKSEVAKRFYNEYFKKGNPAITDSRYYIVRLLIGMDKNKVLELYKENTDSNTINRVEYESMISTIHNFNHYELISKFCEIN